MITSQKFFYNSKDGICRFDDLQDAKVSAGVTASSEKRSIVVMEEWFSPKRSREVILCVAVVCPG